MLVVPIVLAGSTAVSLEVSNTHSTPASIVVSIMCWVPYTVVVTHPAGVTSLASKLRHRRGVDDDVDVGHRISQGPRVADVAGEELAAVVVEAAFYCGHSRFFGVEQAESGELGRKEVVGEQRAGQTFARMTNTSDLICTQSNPSTLLLSIRSN